MQARTICSSQAGMGGPFAAGEKSTDTEKRHGVHLNEMFFQTFRRRTPEEVEDYLIVGTARTTPPLAEVPPGFPKPWLFARVLLFFGLIYLGFTLGYLKYRNDALMPGLILMGTFAAPLTTLTLFFELNFPRNVSVYRLAILLSVGGLVSLLLSLVGYDIRGLDRLSPCSAGIIEELAKLSALILIVQGQRYPFILNGMLFGAAVGAGFGAFESAGMALRVLAQNGASSMLTNIAMRGMLAPLMHVAWTAMAGAALWRAKKSSAVTLATLVEPRFCKVLLLVILLHALWNLPCPEPPFHLRELVLGGSAWLVIGQFARQGLTQVREQQRLLRSVKSDAASTSLTDSGVRLWE